jgi:hypothetical protein
VTLFADILATCWVVFVGVVYYGGTFVPEIGTRTAQFVVIYILMLVFSLVYAYLNRSARTEGEPVNPPVN